MYTRFVQRLLAVFPLGRGGSKGFLIAFLLMVMALALRLAMAPVDAGLQYVTFFPAVTLSAVIAGFWPGLFATIIGLLLASFVFTFPYSSVSFEAVQNSFWSNLVFLTDGLVVCFSIEAMHRYRRRYAQELRDSKEAQEALASSSHYSRQILDNLFTLVALLDSGGVVLEMNRAAFVRSGYSREGTIGQYFHDLPGWSYDKNVQGQLMEAIQAAMQGQVTRHDVTVKLAGGMAPLDFQISPVRDDNGKIIGSLATAVDISAREKAEEALRASESKFRILFESANDCLMVLDLDGRIRDINRTGYERLGYTREEMVGKNISQFNPPEFAAKVSARFAQVREGGHITFESASVRRNGSVMPTEVNARLVELDGRQQVFSVVRDVSDRKEEEEQFRLMTRTSLDGFWITDERGRFTEVNNAYCDLIGYSRDELLHMGISDVEAIETPEETARHIRQLMETGSIRFETRHRTKDGRILDIEASATHSGNYGGKLYCFLRDITDRKRDENSLRESAERLQAHIDNSPLAVVAWDKDFRVTQWAGEAERMFGWSAGETVGKLIMDLHMIYDEDIPLVEKTMEKLTSGLRYVISSNRNVTKDGRVIHCEWYNTALANEDGTMASVMSQVLDVTARKRIEEEMLVMNDHLLHEVAMRTADLSALTANIQNIAEMERANLARELHDDLGSTLVGIGMSVNRLRENASGIPALLRDVSAIQGLVAQAVEVKRAVVNQLYPTVLDNFGIIAAIEWQVGEFRKHSGIDVDLAVPNEPIEMEHAFALAAYRITQECLTNIAKHAGASRICVEVTAGDGFLDLTVRDNGRGLPEGLYAGGHGIFGMIERARYLGGSMEIESREDGGTMAHLYLPLKAAKPKDKKRVLVVDDHAIFRDAIRNLLDCATDDFAVCGEAGDGEAAVDMAVSEDWDIVLLDVTLPKENGVAALEKIKAAKPELPVIILSGHSEGAYAGIAKSKGAACYIEKGETDGLVEAMRRAILL